MRRLAWPFRMLWRGFSKMVLAIYDWTPERLGHDLRLTLTSCYLSIMATLIFGTLWMLFHL